MVESFGGYENAIASKLAPTGFALFTNIAHDAKPVGASLLAMAFSYPLKLSTNVYGP